MVLFVCGVGSCDRNSRGVVWFEAVAVKIKRCRDWIGEFLKLGTVFDDRRKRKKKHLSSTSAKERKIEEEDKKGRRVSIYIQNFQSR